MNIGYDCPCWGRYPPDPIDIEKPSATAQDFLELSADLDFTDASMKQYWQQNTEQGDAASDAFILRHIECILADWRKHMTASALKSVREFEKSFDVDFDVLKEVYAI